jgi:hypothetical protein
MVCYLVPMLAALVHSGFRKKVKRMNANPYQRWLSLLLAGGAMFGVIDHLWNGELFLIGPNILSDLALGTVITLGIACIWGGIVLMDKAAVKKPAPSS